jgi:tRNA-dihydrouridine synthase
MEKFKKLSRWDYVGMLKKKLKIPVAGNGDVADAGGLVRRAEGDCDAVMVGRAAVRQPWIFAAAKAGGAFSVPDIEGTGLQFLELLARCQPPEFHVSRAMRFFGFFCDNLKWGNYLKTQLNRQKTLSGIEQVWRKHFLDMTY